MTIDFTKPSLTIPIDEIINQANIPNQLIFTALLKNPSMNQEKWSKILNKLDDGSKNELVMLATSLQGSNPTIEANLTTISRIPGVSTDNVSNKLGEIFENIYDQNQVESRIKDLLAGDIQQSDLLMLMSTPQTKAVLFRVLNQDRSNMDKLNSVMTNLLASGQTELLLEIAREVQSAEQSIAETSSSGATFSAQLVVMQLQFERTGTVTAGDFDPGLVDVMSKDSRFSALLGQYIETVGVDAFVDGYELKSSNKDGGSAPTTLDAAKLETLRKALVSFSPESAALMITKLTQNYSKNHQASLLGSLREQFTKAFNQRSQAQSNAMMTAVVVEMLDFNVAAHGTVSIGDMEASIKATFWGSRIK